MLEQSVPDVPVLMFLYLMEGTHARTVLDEMQPVGRTHIRAVLEGLNPNMTDPMLEQGKSARKEQQR